MSRKYRIGVWDLTYYKIDEETDEPLRDDKGNVILFRADEDVSQLAEGIDEKLLEEVKNCKIKISTPDWIQLYTRLADFTLSHSSLDCITEIDENGDERYTPEKQEEFNYLVDEIETILESFFEKEED